MSLPRLILAAAFGHASDLLSEIHDLILGAKDTADTPQPDDSACSDCGRDHTAVLDLLTGRRPKPEALDGPSAVDREWSPAFADQAALEDVIAVEGAQLGRDDLGLRALRVKSIRPREHHMLGGTVETLVFLLQDEDSGEPFTARLDRDQALRIAAIAPDQVPADMPGGSA